MNTRRGAVLLVVLTGLALVALAGNILLLWARSPSYGPVCVGLIVTGCEGAAAPARAGSSPLAFVALLVIGAWGTTWIANRSRSYADEDYDPERKGEEEEVHP